MTTSDWVMVAAVIVAPILAVQAQKMIERMGQKRASKLWIFNTLMGTRATRLAPQHIQALNMIDLAFYGRKLFGLLYDSEYDKAVREAWKVYLDHLATDASTPNWGQTGETLFTELLEAMADCLGYHFDRVQIQKGIYLPKGHSELEAVQLSTQLSLEKVLNGRQPLPIMVVPFPAQSQAQAQPAPPRPLPGS